MAKTYFFSDAHLGMSPPKSERVKERRLLSFLDHVATSAERLVIVGDLFDFWFEYRTVVPRGYTRVLCALSHLRDLGKEIHYVAGNHDFWMRDFLRDELGIQIHFDALELTIAGKRFFVLHGDGVSRRDWRYRILKRIFRHPVNIFLYSLLHPDVGIPLARWVAALSRDRASPGELPDESDYIRLAMAKFEQGFDYAIFGHLHHPSYQVFGEKVYLNLGDWITHFTYGEFDGYRLELNSWR
ncbi:MAG: UDP-2,3-diacylglucosamine diphosphatase [Calditrichaeota bacterium]|nr:MAG: UDP-2,3-diacylglucosamine diphosphatase [Calditrichota bacterium]